jgi:hypothetical protein
LDAQASFMVIKLSYSVLFKSFIFNVCNNCNLMFVDSILLCLYYYMIRG